MKKTMVKANVLDARHQANFDGMARIIDATRQSAVRSANVIMTASYCG